MIKNISINSPVFTIINYLPLSKRDLSAISSNPSLLEDFLRKPLDSFAWPVRVNNVFNHHKLKTVEDVFNILDKLTTYENFGKKSYTDVLKTISSELNQYIRLVYRNINKSEKDIDIDTILELGKGVLGSVIRSIQNKAMLCKTSIEMTKFMKNTELLNKFLNMPIESIDWSIRTGNVLREIKVKAIADLSHYTELELLKNRNFGKKCLSEIFDKLGKFTEGFIEVSNGKRKLATRKVPAGDLKALTEHMLSVLSIREQQIISKRFGLWDGKRETLAKLSKGFGLTRERIRQIQMAVIHKLKRNKWLDIIERDVYKTDNCLDLWFKEFFDTKLRNFMENNYNIANRSEMIQIIYAIDGEDIGVDISNEFLSEVFFDGEDIFSKFVLFFDENVTGLYKDEGKIYSKVIKQATSFLKKEGNPQSMESIISHFEEIKFISRNTDERKKISRFLSVSSITRDSLGKFGLETWKSFNSYTIHGMAERALQEIGRPAHFSQITLLMEELFPEYRPFHAHSIHGRIGGMKKTFTWVSPGVYGLRSWGLERPPFVKDYLVELLKKANEPLHINVLTRNTLERCNCQPPSIGMTLGLNKDTFKKYRGNYYGLTKWK